MKVTHFSPEEVKETGRYYTHEGTSYGYPFNEVEILNYPITPKENFFRFMRREDFYWVPNLATDFNVFGSTVNPDLQAVSFEGGRDAFGVPWVPVEHNEALPALAMSGNPLLKDIEDWRELPFPEPLTWDWESAAAQYEKVKNPTRANYCFFPEAYFERLITLMDFVNAAMALASDSEETAAFMQRLTDYHIQLLECYKKYFDVDLIFISDDWGTQLAPFFSNQTCQEVFVPAYRRFVQRAHELGVYTMTHSCGVVHPLIPQLLEIGTDIWEPQIELNPMRELMEEYGDRLLFHSYAIVEDCEDLEKFRQVNTQRFRQYLSSRRMFVEFSAWGENADEKNRIVYELLRKAATGEL